MRQEAFSLKIRRKTAFFGMAVALFIGGACDAVAASAPTTKLVSCEEGNCLQVSGRRADTGSTVLINGRAVAVDGGRAWKVVLPLRTVRAWSAPMARTVAVSVMQDGASSTQEAELPIGLLGHVTELASLVIGSR